MSTVWNRWSSVLLATAAVSGCASPEFVSEHPVDNQIPPLKAGVYSIKAVDVRPVATREVEPEYPFELESIVAGKAVVVFTVRADGKVADAAIVEADDVLFGEAAVAAVVKWRFRPAQVKSVPVDCRMTLPFFFDSSNGYYLLDDSMPDPSKWGPPNGSLKGTVDHR